MARGDAEGPAEGPGEIIRVAEAKAIGDLPDHPVRILDQLGGPVQAQMQEIPAGPLPAKPLEQAA